MRACPKCGATYPDTVQFCPTDGTALAPAQPEGGADPRVGTLVDRYRLVSRLGEGGMGVVYRAEHTIIGRQVALKLLHPHLSAVPEAVDRFFREARAAGEMATDNIVQITDSGRADDGTGFLVMELLQGESLADLLEREGWLGPRRTAGIALQIARALQTAHDKGVIHRDLKPPNVQLLPGDRVKLLDFGVAKITESNTKLTQTGMIVGSPAYMSPEQASGKQVDRRTDVYAFGVMLYEMLAGETPFTGTNATEILLAHVMKEPPSPRTRRADIPDELHALIMECLVKSPDGRPPDMATVAARLEAYHQGAPQDAAVPAPPPPATGKQVITGEGAAPADPLAATFATPAQAVAAPQAPTPQPSTSADAAMQPTVSTGAGMQPAVPATTAQTAAPGRGRTALFIVVLAVLVVVGGAAAALLLGGGEERGPTAQPPAATTTTTAAPDARVAARQVDSSVQAPDATAVAAVVPAGKEHAGQQPAGKGRPKRRPGSRRRPADDHADSHGDSHAGGDEAPEEITPPKKTAREHVVLRTVPPGATVVRERQNIGKTPLKIPVPRKQRLVISLPGYRARTLDIGPTSPAEIKVRLKAAPASHKSISQLERNCRSGRVGLLDCARLRLKLKRERDAALAHAKQRWESRQITWDQYKARVDRIHATYR